MSVRNGRRTGNGGGVSDRRDNESMSRAYRLFAPVYDLVFGPVLEPGRRRAVSSLAAAPGSRILEVGVGTGLSLAAYPANVRVTGIDLAPGMLAKARARVSRKRLSHVEELVPMDACAMRFEAARFDAVVAMYVVSVVDDPVRLVREMRRVCKPGGDIVIVNHFRTDSRLVRAAEVVLKPIHRLVRFRSDLDLSDFTRRTGLCVERAFPVNVMGYSTVLCCRNAGNGAGGAPEGAPGTLP